MKNILFLALFLVSLTGCGIGVRCPDPDECLLPWFRGKAVHRCDNGIVFERVMANVQHIATKFKYERRLKLLDSGVWYDHSIDKLRMDFSTMALLDFCEARMLLVDLVDATMFALESDNDLMVELQQRDIDPRSLEIYIDFKAYIGKMVDYDYVGWIALQNGCANYYAFDMRTDKLSWWQRRSETFAESRAIVYAMRGAEKDWEETHAPAASALEENRFRFEAKK